jgi:iron-sulfur cluster repair protein YtfE (RIC family)
MIFILLVIIFVLAVAFIFQREEARHQKRMCEIADNQADKWHKRVVELFDLDKRRQKLIAEYHNLNADSLTELMKRADAIESLRVERDKALQKLSKIERLFKQP